ncbi:hypothetical protein K457DRAFT_626094 [Linnemannia elongata AG-77]|uniref:Uncharacterized protein n=1 Tax=Linnemannia elongata AG-77 TaxID=1314771 RepID=A0A197JRH8_9FUNG|nr:hypothetical protein K457DRAFT_626094 [Linnemannia elongata AG-77]
MTHRGSIERRKKKGQGKGDKPRLDPWRRDHGSLWDTLSLTHTHTLSLSPLLSLSLNPLFSLKLSPLWLLSLCPLNPQSNSSPLPLPSFLYYPSFFLFFLSLLL